MSVILCNDKAPSYRDSEWRPKKSGNIVSTDNIVSTGNMKLKKSISKGISLQLYKQDGLIDHTNYKVIESHGLMLKKGIEKYKTRSNMQLITVIYSPDAVGGELYFKNSNKDTIIVAQQKRKQWTWVVIRVPELVELLAKPMIEGTKTIFTTEIMAY